MATKKNKKKTSTVSERRERAVTFFKTSKNVPSWLIGLIDTGYDAGDDGSCHIATENPDEARHAKQISLKAYADAHRENLIAFLQTSKGRKEFQSVLARSYEDLQEEDQFADEEEDEDD